MVDWWVISFWAACWRMLLLVGVDLLLDLRVVLVIVVCVVLLLFCFGFLLCVLM